MLNAVIYRLSCLCNINHHVRIFFSRNCLTKYNLTELIIIKLRLVCGPLKLYFCIALQSRTGTLRMTDCQCVSMAGALLHISLINLGEIKVVAVAVETIEIVVEAKAAWRHIAHQSRASLIRPGAWHHRGVTAGRNGWPKPTTPTCAHARRALAASHRRIIFAAVEQRRGGRRHHRDR